MSKRILLALLLLSFIALVLATSCSEPPPGEVGGKVTRGGQNYGALMKAVKDGTVVAEAQVIDGVYFLTNLPPGEYSIQCWTRDGEMLKEEAVTVDPEGSTPLNFVLE